MQKWIAGGLAGAAALALAPQAEAQLITQKALTHAIALTIAQTAVETCKAKGYSISVHVVGREGETIVAIRGDGASPSTWENSRRKAYTARSTRAPSAAFAERLAKNEPLAMQQATLQGMIGIAGGLPIKAPGANGQDEVIGGGGVSGSPGGNDEPCLQAGIDKVKDQLK
jgi:uncharacterized protein GlcG (DUF336 family)